MDYEDNLTWMLLLDSLQRAVESGQLEPFLHTLLTTEEKDDLGKRCEILLDLLEGEKPQREICLKRQVSQYKISRGVHALQQISLSKKQILYILKGDTDDN